jgi:protein SCO1/2
MNHSILASRWLACAGLGAGLGLATIFTRSPLPQEASCCAPAGESIRDASAETGDVATGPAAPADSSRPMSIPDVPLVDQAGRPVRFYTDLVKDRVVAINFIFTTCQGICPPLGTAFGKLQAELKGRGIRLISVSVDPVNDTPERLAAWGKRFGAGPDWTLVTGAKQDVDGLLRAVGVFAADKANHSPFVLVGNDRKGIWRRVHGLTAPENLATAIEALAGPRTALAAPAGRLDADPESPPPDSPARRYFGDVELVNQDGRTMRLYSDMIRGKVVVIHAFFSACKNTCPVMLSTYRKLQEHLGDRLGRDVHLISFTVDPDNDGAEVLKDLTRRIDARPGWSMLTGTKENLRTALGKLGLAVERPEEHSNLFLIGNDRTQYWKKVRGLAPANQIIASLEEVIADQGNHSPTRNGGLSAAAE